MTNLFANAVQDSIEYIRAEEPVGGFGVAFSGGKDSVVLLDIVKRAGVRYEAFYSVTTVDPPEVVRFIRRAYPEVRFIHPPMGMWRLIARKGIPPLRRKRWCCRLLKHRSNGATKVLTGVRAAESIERAKRGEQDDDGVPRNTYYCKDAAAWKLAPLFCWSDNDVWEYIAAKGLAVPSLYREGFSRIGCLLCPLAPLSQRHAQAERWPKYKAAYIRAFEQMLVQKQARGWTPQPGDWRSGQDVYDWWMRDHAHDDELPLIGYLADTMLAEAGGKEA